MRRLAWLCLFALGCAFALPSYAQSDLFVPARVANGMIVLDSTQPVLNSDEVCNPTEPLVVFDVVFSNQDPSAGCKAFTAADLVPGLKFMVVKGDKHSLTVRYPETHPPTVERYNKPSDDGLQFCVRVRMPGDLKLQRRSHTDAATASGVFGLVLTCTNQTCRTGSGECCCSSASCSCMTCYCGAGCADCSCDGEDGGSWAMNKAGGHRGHSPSASQLQQRREE